MKKSILSATVLLLLSSNVIAGNIVANDAQSQANALNLQGQSTTSVNTTSNRLSNDQGQGQGQDQYQGQSNEGFNNGQKQANTGFNNGQQQGIGFYQDFSNNSVNKTDLSEAVGTAVAPALTTTLTETCMGSTSVGAGFSGGSFSFGTTWRDSACVRRLDSRQIQSMGDVQAAKEIMCDSSLVREAFKRVGRPCAEDGGTYTVVAAPVVTPVPAAVVAPAPMTSTNEVTDEQDLSDRRDYIMSEKAKAAREAIRSKYNF